MYIIIIIIIITIIIKSLSICKHYLSEHSSDVPRFLSEQFHVLTKGSNKLLLLLLLLLLTQQAANTKGTATKNQSVWKTYQTCYLPKGGWR